MVKAGPIVGTRRSLTATQRKEILSKTGGRCHICGVELRGRWAADHVLHHAKGGEHARNNYLAACRFCNGLRWSRSCKQLRKILRLGTYAQLEIRHGTKLGRELAELYTRRRREVRGRRKGKSREC